MEKKQILIIVPSYGMAARKAYYEFPLGLVYVSSCLKQEGYTVDNFIKEIEFVAEKYDIKNLAIFDDHIAVGPFYVNKGDVLCTKS